MSARWYLRMYKHVRLPRYCFLVVVARLVFPCFCYFLLNSAADAAACKLVVAVHLSPIFKGDRKKTQDDSLATQIVDVPSYHRICAIHARPVAAGRCCKGVTKREMVNRLNHFELRIFTTMVAQGCR